MKYRMILIGKSENAKSENAKSENAKSENEGHLDVGTADLVRQEIESAGELVWLGENEACAFLCDTQSRDTPPRGARPRPAQPRLSEATLSLLEKKRIDWICLPEGEGKKRCLVADMDSTIIMEESLDILAAKSGLGGEIAAMTASAMEGKMPFVEALQMRTKLLKGIREALLEEISEKDLTLRAGAETLTKTMRKNGAKTLLLSGGFSVFVAKICQRAHFDSHEANHLEILNGKLTGEVLAPIRGAQEKRQSMEGFAKEHGFKAEDVLAIGDGANDIPMLRAAGLGVGFHAKPATIAATHLHIRHSDLTALLYLQGYRKEEFV